MASRAAVIDDAWLAERERAWAAAPNVKAGDMLRKYARDACIAAGHAVPDWAASKKTTTASGGPKADQPFITAGVEVPPQVKARPAARATRRTATAQAAFHPRSINSPAERRKVLSVAPAQPFDMPDALRAWRAQVPGRVVQVRLGRVTLWPGLGAEPRVYLSMDAAVQAVAPGTDSPSM